MKIMTLYINNSDRMYGGAYRRYMELIKGFLKEGDQVHHFSPPGFSNIKHGNFYHYDIKKIPIYPSYLPFLLQVIPKSIILGRKIGFDIILTFSLFDALIGVLIRLFLRNLKVVFCDRADAVGAILLNRMEKSKNHHLTSIIGFFLRKIEKFVYLNSDFIIFNSPERRENIKKKYSLKTNKIELIYNNANPSWVIANKNEAIIKSNKIREKYGEKKILCYIGNLYIEGRDLETLLKSFKKVKEHYPDIILIMVGSGPDENRLKKLINELKFDSADIFLVGWKGNPMSYMLASDIVIVTALHEGCSNTVLESIYAESVTLGSRVGGIPQLLKYNELLFSPKNNHELSIKIIALLKNQEEYLKTKNLIKKRKEKFMFDWNSRMIKSIKSYSGGSCETNQDIKGSYYH